MMEGFCIDNVKVVINFGGDEVELEFDNAFDFSIFEKFMENDKQQIYNYERDNLYICKQNICYYQYFDMTQEQ